MDLWTFGPKPTMSNLGVPLDVVVHVLYGEVDVGYLYPKIKVTLEHFELIFNLL